MGVELGSERPELNEALERLIEVKRGPVKQQAGAGAGHANVTSGGSRRGCGARAVCARLPVPHSCHIFAPTALIAHISIISCYFTTFNVGLKHIGVHLIESMIAEFPPLPPYLPPLGRVHLGMLTGMHGAHWRVGGKG